MPDVSPVHHSGCKINQVVGLDGEKICGHELTNGTIAMFPFIRLRVSDNRPTMNRLTLPLICEHCGRQSSPVGVFCSGVSVLGKRLHYPACTGLPASRPCFDDPEILINVSTRYARTAQALARKREKLVQD